MPTEMFDYLYKDRTEELEEQRLHSKMENKQITKNVGASEHSAKNAGVVGELEEV
jgi:hypothetical protein